MKLPEGLNKFPFVEVRFKGSRKDFFLNKEALPLKVGDYVAVESSPGHDIGTVSMIGDLVRMQMRKKQVSEDAPDLKSIYRMAKEADVEKWKEVIQLENPAMTKSREFAKRLKLSMKINDVEFQGDRKKFTIFYTADHRVDFRELIKLLSDEFKARVEMKQIGLRQEAGKIGGIGDCGRELCCSTWLTDFRAVTTSAARYQNLSLNPTKLSGQCGKLKCCLNYELDAYMEALGEFPNSNTPIFTEKGKAVHQKTDIFKGKMWYAYIGEPGSHDFSDAWVELPASRVKTILEMNKKNEKPADLKEFGSEPVPVKLPDYENVVGQDSLTRMDNKFKKKGNHKSRKKPGKGNPQGNNRPPKVHKPNEEKP